MSMFSEITAQCINDYLKSYLKQTLKDRSEFVDKVGVVKADVSYEYHRGYVAALKDAIKIVERWGSSL